MARKSEEYNLNFAKLRQSVLLSLYDVRHKKAQEML
jgi:hypothetical protein